MKKLIHLTIDARIAKSTQITLIGPGLSEIVTNTGTDAHSQVILPLIEQVLQKHSLALPDIADITVLVDHGSFTGRRVAAAIAQMLGSLLHVPVNGASSDTPIDIPYEEDKWK